MNCLYQKKHMTLSIDIGNTNINFGIFKNSKLVKVFFIKTREKELTKCIKRSLNKLYPEKIIISSVVPKATLCLIKSLKIITPVKPVVLGRDMIVPIKNLYRKPKEVGQDRLVNAYAGIKLYGSPLIVIDFGTAITFDVISKNKEYLGGMIVPGLRMSLEALHQKTALLPKVELGAPKEFIGRETQNSILSGVIYGFSAMTDDLVERIKLKIGKNACLPVGKAKVIATGGNVNLIAKYCKKIDKIDTALTLKGLNLLTKSSVF